MIKRTQGFTIVEVLIVVIVVGVLAAIGIAAYNQVQANARDNQRATDIGVLAAALEQYYHVNHVYPSCAKMTQSANTVVSNLLVGLNRAVLVAPSAPDGTTNSIVCTALSSGSGTDSYAYVVRGGCSGDYCYGFTLQYRQETTGDVISRESIRCGQYYYSTC